VPAAEIIPVPENMDMTINADFAKIKYTTYDLNNLDGQIVVKNSVARLQDCTADVIGGQIGLTGDYNTQNLAKPTFNMDMALQNMGFKEAFQTFATVKTLAPVAQLIDGKFNTNLSMSGVLGKDMMPDFTTLSAAGFLETISAIFNNFKPMNSIADKLNISHLKQLELKNTKNWFEIKDGKVSVKPFNTQVRDVAMQISGSHGISSDMEYQILSKVPRKSLGSAANSGLNLLSSEASKVGVNIAQGEFINVRFDLTGTMFNPKIGMKVLGSDGQSSIQETAAGAATAIVDKAKDSLTNVVNREVDKAKQKVEDAAQKAADSLKRVAEQKMQETTDKATKEAKDKIGEKAGDVLGEEGQKKVDDVKDKLNNFDPFKKKKKN
jgi:vacuolar-type H+-ATPase subunit H